MDLNDRFGKGCLVIWVLFICFIFSVIVCPFIAYKFVKIMGVDNDSFAGIVVYLVAYLGVLFWGFMRFIFNFL